MAILSCPPPPFPKWRTFFCNHCWPRSLLGKQARSFSGARWMCTILVFCPNHWSCRCPKRSSQTSHVKLHFVWERTFSIQKFVDTPLRNALQDELVQAMLFVKFNFLNFGERSMIPPKLLTPPPFFYRNDLDLEDDFSHPNPSATSSTDPDSSFLQFWHL